MLGIRLKLSRPGRLSLLAAFALLIGLAVATSGTGYASPPNAIKQFAASISPLTGSGQVSGSWTETVTNCGSTSSLPCSLNSAIAIGTIQIAVPTSPNNFQTYGITNLSCSLCAPSAVYPNAPSTWTVSYSSGVIQANAIQGTNKLQPGQSVQISFTAKPATCAVGPDPFTTSASGSLPPPPFTDKFTIAGNQPTVTINGCNLDPGQDATGPNGTNVTNDSDVTVSVSFGGNLSCSNDTTYGPQWSKYQLPDEVNITPLTTPGPNDPPKAFTFKFNQSIFGGDSSWYLICYQSDTPFKDKSNNLVTTGLLPACYDPATNETGQVPCVSDQHLTTGDLTNVANDQVVIKIRVPASDPHAK